MRPVAASTVPSRGDLDRDEFRIGRVVGVTVFRFNLDHIAISLKHEVAWL